ncbi:MAG: hypothetical protein JRI77_04295 [Deltaproteobacteria bacterium]|nr:hypothetical protein [Deltaproteobacteria bacterium]
MEGAVLALSGAMPGLAGATLRRGGRLRQMRGEISYANDHVICSGKQGQLTLKLFNLTLKDLGPRFLQRGIWVKGKELQHFLTQRVDLIRQNCRDIRLNGHTADISKIVTTDWGDSDVLFTVAYA